MVSTLLVAASIALASQDPAPTPTPPATPRAAPAARGTLLSNVGPLPQDEEGRPLITGETSVLTVNGTHYFYVNDWGSCASVDCCASAGGCASCCFVPPSARYPDPCVFADGHRVVVYATQDLAQWRLLGVALPPANRPRGIEFRPHIIHNAKRQEYVMWYEDRPPPSTKPGHKFDSKGYNVAVSSSPAGPFETIATGVQVRQTRQALLLHGSSLLPAC